MMQICLEKSPTQLAVFELVVRTLAPRRNFLVAAGLEQALQFLTSLSFSEAEFAWLRDQGGLSAKALDDARTLRFEGDVDAMPEGTVFFAGEPILRVTAPLPMAQLVESRLLNLVHFETAIASSAARLVLASRGRRLLDFGLRKAHGGEAALLTARATYLAGFDGTTLADASQRFGIPVLRTLCIGPGETDVATLVSLGRAMSERTTLLIDPGDATTPLGALVESVAALCRDGLALAGVQIEGIDLAPRARSLRTLLDAAGLAHLSICAGVDLDETGVEALIAEAAPIDEFGLRGWLPTEGGATRVDAYYAMRHDAAPEAPPPTATGGARAASRRIGADRRAGRAVSGESPAEAPERDALLQPCMRKGERVGRALTLQESRTYHARQIAQLPDALRKLEPAPRPLRAVQAAAAAAVAARPGAGDGSRS